MALFLGALGVACKGDRPMCEVPITSASAKVLALAALEGRDSLAQTDVELDFRYEAVPLLLHGQCLVAVALSWDGLHEGALVVADSARRLLFSDTTYRGASNLHVTPRGRIVFEYIAAWGSGLWETRAIGLCPLGAEVWIACLELTLDHTVSVVGGADYPGSYEQHGELRTSGDTLIVLRRVSLEAYNHRWPSESSAAVTIRMPLP